MIYLGAQKKIDAIKVVWSQPFATDFAVEYGYFVGPEDLSQRLPTDWRPFPQGAINKATGGAEILKLSSQPWTIRYVRLRLNESSGTGPDKSRDIRDRLGYAIREINLGYLDGHGGFHDAIHHAASRNAQTVVYVSSTDPWHREIDRDPETEQPGFDFVFKSGLTNGLPLLLPVAVLYDTPENAAAEIQYLKARGYPFEQVEMGEEPDGQFVNAEHFAALYLQFAKAIHRVRPELHLGGPSMQDIEQSQVPGQIDFGKAGWLGRFLRYLKAHDKLDEFSFFSFEWYPFGDDCEPRKFLPRSTQMMADALDELQQGGLKHDIPWIITEYGYSAFAARAEVDIDGALFNADLVAFFLTRGGDAAYLYGYEASEIIREQKCSAGNNMMFFRGDSGHERKPTATYWVARMLTQDWAKPGDELHEMYAAESTVHDHEGNATVTAYALRRLDGLWSLLLINRSPSTSYETTLRFQNASNGASSAFIGSLDLFQYSHAQYQLNSDRYNPYPIRDEPPAHETIRADQDSGIVLPPSSITVVRGQVGGL
jgi:hypothetical protein